jgi:hypothetical protein
MRLRSRDLAAGGDAEHTRGTPAATPSGRDGDHRQQDKPRQQRQHQDQRQQDQGLQEGERPPTPRAEATRHSGNVGSALRSLAVLLLLLCSGCSVALLSQHMGNLGIGLAAAQAPAWTKYTLNFLLSAGAEWAGMMLAARRRTVRGSTGARSSSSSNSSPHAAAPLHITRRQSTLLTVMG